MRNQLKKTSAKLFAVLFASVLMFASCASTSGADSQSKNGTVIKMDSAIKCGTLDNGMKYYVRKNSIPANRIVLRLFVKTGSAMEDDDQQGVAHFIEHMAFNGTENFEKSAIVDYFEKIGMTFGAGLNAHTSFEETVYKLEIPADDPKMLETAMLILHDWACAISFDEEELNKERGVITEEWRLGQNLNGRINDNMVNLLYKDSRFPERFPIGKMDVIKNISRERVLDYYKKWYKPELMSIVAVGDCDVKILEKEIKKAMSVIPASQNKQEFPDYQVPVQKNKIITVMKDKEMPVTQICIFNRVEDYKVSETVEDIQSNMARQIAALVFNLKLNELSISADCPWLSAGVTEYRDNDTVYNYLIVNPKNGKTQEALKLLFDQVDRFMDFGTTEAELERCKQGIMSQIELTYQNKDKTENINYVESLLNYIRMGSIPMSAEDTKKYGTAVLQNITIDQVNQEACKSFNERGNQMLVLANADEKLPSESDFMSLWKDYKNPELSAYEDTLKSDSLMKRPSVKASVVSKSKNKNLGTTEYMLSNGIKIITKKTDFEKNIVYMDISSWGGKFQIDEKDVFSAEASLPYVLYSGIGNLSYNDITKIVQTKNVNLSFGIYNDSEGFYGRFKYDNNETMLQLVNLLFSQPKFTDEGWNVVMEQLKSSAEAHGKQPEDDFSDKVNEILYGKNNVYYHPFDLEYFNQINKDSAERIYRQRFANPADFTVVFAGDFNEAQLIENCCYYLGTLATTEEREEGVYKLFDFPQGKPQETVKKGIGDLCLVYIGFGGELPEAQNVESDYKDRLLVSVLQDLLNIKLREVIREDKSGSYGVYSNGGIEGISERSYKVGINFGCEPGRVQELTDTVISQIQKLQNEPVDSVYVEKIKENLRRSRETNLYDNNWWITRIKNEQIYGTEPDWIHKDINRVTDWITGESLQETAKKYLNTENYVSVFLVPEK